MRSKLKEIQDEGSKREVEKLIVELVDKVKILDNQHRDIVNIRKLSDEAGSIRDHIISIRKRIYKKLKMV